MRGRRNICLVVEYDGGSYHGWQRQPNGLTVQEVLEEAVRRVTGVRSPVIGSGRTDAGVHALGQTAAFRTDHPLAGELFAKALNANLPADVRVLASREVAPSFHPQYDAVGKTYLYLILNRPQGNALLRGRVWHLRPPLDAGAMAAAARALVGEHDFSAFRSSSCNASSPVRRLDLLQVERRGALLELTFRGNGFLKNMVRNLTGTLVQAGLGQIPPEEVAAILQGRERSAAGPCAPPWGLYLVSVAYG
jgi:tRNA pseudouridine38-40 synthase